MEDLEILLELCLGVVTKWKDLGIYLGFSPSHLAIIEHHPLLIVEGPHGYMRELFSQWLKWTPPSHQSPTLEKLAYALNEIVAKRVATDLRDHVLKQKKGL